MSIRGVASAAVAASGDGAVAYHLDSVPLPTSVFETEFYDVERVEVLRGPQGTLYGANATAGTVNMIFARPTNEAGGNVEIEYGDYNSKKIKLAIIGGGLISENLISKIQNLTTNCFQTYGMTETISHIALRSLKNCTIKYSRL